MKLTHRIIVLAAIPLLGFAVQCGRILADDLESRKESLGMSQRVGTLETFSRVVHELQKERGISSLHVSGGVAFDAVEGQRSGTDAALDSFRVALAESGFTEAELAGARQALDGLPALRSGVGPNADAAAVRKGYTKLIAGALSLYGGAISGPLPHGVGRCLTSLAILEDAKESSGQLRAFMASLFAKDAPMTPEQRKVLFQLNARIEGSLGSPALSLTAAGRETLDRIQSDETAREVESMFLALVEKGDRGGYGVDGKASFAAMTRRIDQIDGIVREESRTERKRLAVLVEESTRSLRWSATFVVLLPLLIIVLVAWIMRDIVLGLRLLSRSVGNIAAGNLLVESDGRTDEIGVVLSDLRRASSKLEELVAEMRHMSAEHDRGDIDVRIDPARFEGSFRTMAEGVNEMVFGHIAVKKKAMACVGEFGRGNFDAPLERFPGKKAFINETIEKVRGNIKEFIHQMNHMSAEHDRGEIDARIPDGKFEGSYRTMAEGVNGMVFGHIAVKKKAMACVMEFGRGNFDAPLEKFPGKKVFINETIEKVRENLKSLNSDTNMLVEAALDGRLSTRADAASHQGDFRKIVQGINDTLDAVINPVNEAAQVLEKVAARDLTARVLGDYRGDLGRIKVAVNTAVDNLDNALSQVSQATLQVSSAAQQISVGSQSLAQGANEQASSLEEVSASLEQMSSMTRQNADNALQAKNLAGEADGNARQGAEAMGRMNTAIVKIKDSSDQTAKIVKTIDEIAMQTNLLALNAAVEAARAGEAGRGFAVVAEEVRNLAQRSAQAAKSTADMIGESVKNADDGVKIAQEVGKSFESIAVSSRKVNDLIAEIASASKEQSMGIEQVNTAVSQMDKVTQQTAANAEESASSSEELSSQAEELQAMVGQFRISGGGAPKDPTRSLGWSGPGGRRGGGRTPLGIGLSFDPAREDF